MSRSIMIWMIMISILTFIVFGLDKQKAVRGKWRIKESTLLLLSLIGGATGGLIGMLLFRHKIRKAKFVIAVPVMFAAQLALLLYLFKTAV